MDDIQTQTNVRTRRTQTYSYDEGFDNERRTRPSTRYRSTTTDQILSDMDDPMMESVEVEYVEPRILRSSRLPAPHTQPAHTKDMPMISYERRRRPNTDEDLAIPPELRRQRRTTESIPIVSTSAPAQRSTMTRRGFLVRAGLCVGAILCVGIGSYDLGSFIKSKWVQYNKELDEGQHPHTEITLVCGHGDDSDAYPTQLHAFVRSDRTIQFEEISTKDNKLIHYFVTMPISFGGPLNQVNLKIIATKQANGRYQIVLHADCGGVGVLQAAEDQKWLFVDNGKGYFEGVQPKGGK